MVWTTYDLSEITEILVNQLVDAVKASKLWTSNGGTIPEFLINITGNSPDSMRQSKDGECQLNFFLLHVGQDPYTRNSLVNGPGAMANTQDPLSLDLTYLLTAYAHENSVREQQAMSIALSWFHENPVYQALPPPGQPQAPVQYLTISLGTDTLSEMSVLWQSFTVAYRLATLYRVAIAFLTPSQAPTALAKNPTQLGLTVAPAALDVAPQLFAPFDQFAFTVPADGQADDVTYAAEAKYFAGGVTIILSGTGLNAPVDVYLSSLDGAQSWTISGWQTVPATGTTITLKPPVGYFIGGAAAPPASTPPPGLYLLAVASAGARGPAIALPIVPRFDNVAVPPVLKAAGGKYSFTGGGFVPGVTQIFVGGMQLDAGLVNISADGAEVTFSLPATQPPGTLPLRVRVDGVDAPPTWQVAA
jgi:hypothetical protein